MNEVEAPSGKAPAAAVERQPAAGRRRPVLGSLAWQGVVGLLALFSLVFMGIALVMNTYGRQQVAEQSAGKLEEAGRRRVEEVRRGLASGSPLDLQRLSRVWQGEGSGYAFQAICGIALVVSRSDLIIVHAHRSHVRHAPHVVRVGVVTNIWWVGRNWVW